MAVEEADAPAGWDVRAASASGPAAEPPAPRQGRLVPRRRPLQPATKAVAWLLVVAGVLALADAGVTLLWQEPLSALYASIQQSRLGGDLRRVERAPPSAPQQRALAALHAESARIAYLAAQMQRHSPYGGAVGRIRIPRLGVSFVVVKGTGEGELQKGPGVYPETPFPGGEGTTAIAGHRTTYLAPFRHIDALRAGDRILLRMPYGLFSYEVTRSRVVLPTDVGVIRPVGYPQLVLSACTPPFSASHRLIVFARLRSVAPLGAARPKSGPAAEIRYPSGARAPRAPSPTPQLPQVLKPLQQLPLSLVA